MGDRESTPTPRATYRVQLHGGFGFDDAAEIAGYLAALGVSHLYASPYLQAASGSTHGYDVVDHSRLNHELGGAEAHARLCSALAEHGLGQLLDIVPNHMAVGDRQNRWWWDVLENGPASVYADHFDIDWDPPESKLRDQVLVPILGDRYGRVLEAGELVLARVGGRFVVRYHDHELPISPSSLDGLLADAARPSGGDRLAGLAARAAELPAPTSTEPADRRRRHRDKERLADDLEALGRKDPGAARAVDAAVAAVNADHTALHDLLERQSYRLAFWRVAGQESVYRRFFDINNLAALRTDREEVLADTHELVVRLVAQGAVHGLRIDHPDGLSDPEAYLDWVRAATGGAWVVVEKIVEPGENLPPSWATSGTTGYDFLNRVGGLFVDPLGEMGLTATYSRFAGVEADFATVAHEKKHLVMRDVLGADVNRLTELAVRVLDRHPHYRDYTRQELGEAVRELLACLPVYRAYVRPGHGPTRRADERYVAETVAEASRRRPDLEQELFDFLGEVLLDKVPGELEAEFLLRFQQASGPVMAKGVEDTAFYTYVRLVALNEVGGSPGHFGTPVGDFHEANQLTAERWPAALATTSTHDTKRSEDVRARLALLSEIPDVWAEAVRLWAKLTAGHRSGDDRPDRNTEWLLYQTLVGAWPLPVGRAVAYMEKATKEAKVHTSWVNPDPAYDEAVRRFVTDILADDQFAESLAAFAEPLVGPGRVNSLAQTVLKLLSPGVADIYQGSELWDLSLVDPDNRRPVDYALRRRLLGALDERPATAVWRDDDEGSSKLLLIARTLAARRRAGDLAGYKPLWAAGPASAHVVAFARDAGLVAVAPRLVLGLARRGGWGDTVLALPDGSWRDVLTGATAAGTVAVGDLLAGFPVAVLEAR